jgi:hypothetical protein
MSHSFEHKVPANSVAETPITRKGYCPASEHYPPFEGFVPSVSQTYTSVR